MNIARARTLKTFLFSYQILLCYQQENVASSLLVLQMWPKPKSSLKIGTANAICWNSLGLFRDYSLNYILLTIKLFFKEFRETSQNLNSIRQWIENMEIKIVWMSWMSWNFVRVHETLFHTDAESFNFLSWKTKKFPKNI